MKLAALAISTLIFLAGCGGGPDEATIVELFPEPEHAWEDKGPAILDGCRSGVDHTEAWSCVYGDPASDQTVVLWGDSHAMQYSPPLIRLAEQKGWRLVSMFRGSCLTADLPFEPACDTWRTNALERVEREKPDLVVTATDTGNGYALIEEGVQLSLEESSGRLSDAYSRTLRKLEGFTGNRPGGVVVIRDLPRAEDPPPDCLQKHRKEPERCDFSGIRRDPPGFDVEAVRQVDGARLIDPEDVICPKGTCPASLDGMVVFRDTAHISATYAVTLTDWLDEQLGDLPAHEPGGAG